MKVLALNSSPRTQVQSKTELMLTHLVEGMRDAGADVELVNLRKQTIKNCIGCFTCWTRRRGGTGERVRARKRAACTVRPSSRCWLGGGRGQAEARGSGQQ